MAINNTIFYPSLASLFSTSFVGKLLNGKHIEHINDVLISNQVISTRGEKVSGALGKVFQILRKNYRCEYMFKTAVLNEIFLKQHDFLEATYLPEFRAGMSKADMVILNGTSTVYEIKSDIDSIRRLESQMASYEQIFENVFAVVSPELLEDTKRLVGKNVGLITVDKNLKMTVLRKASSNIPRLDKNIIFDSLRKEEYLHIIKNTYGKIPKVPNTHIYSDCKELFCKLTNLKAHREFVNVLKNRKLNSTQITLIKKTSLPLKCLLAGKYYNDFECKKISFGLGQTLN